jgi:hypothetical protein
MIAAFRLLQLSDPEFIPGILSRLYHDANDVIAAFRCRAINRPSESQKESGWFSLPDAMIIRCSSNFLTG